MMELLHYPVSQNHTKIVRSLLSISTAGSLAWAAELCRLTS